MNANHRLLKAALYGDHNEMREARHNGARDFVMALEFACISENREAIRLAKCWLSDDINNEIFDAAASDDMEAVLAARKTGLVDYDIFLSNCAAEGNLKYMRFAKDWGATNFNGAFLEAVKYKKWESMKLLIDWGADNFKDAFFIAKKNDFYGFLAFLYAILAEKNDTEWLKVFSEEKIIQAVKKSLLQS